MRGDSSRAADVSAAEDLGETSKCDKLRRPCSNCPWRVDAPRGYWDPQHFVEIWKNCQEDGINVMLCHKSVALPKEQQADIPCQGWIRVLGLSAIGVRLLLIRHKISLKEVEDTEGPELFPTFAAMMRANRIRLPRRSKRLSIQRAKRLLMQAPRRKT